MNLNNVLRQHNSAFRRATIGNDGAIGAEALCANPEEQDASALGLAAASRTGIKRMVETLALILAVANLALYLRRRGQEQRIRDLDERLKRIELKRYTEANVVLAQKRVGEVRESKGRSPCDIEMTLTNNGRAAAQDVELVVDGVEILPAPIELAAGQTRQVLVREEDLGHPGWGVIPNSVITWHWRDGSGRSDRTSVTI